MFSQFNNCKFDRCAYAHDQYVKNKSNIDELNNEIIELKKSVEKLSESCPNEAKIKTLEEEVKVLKLEIKRLFAFTRKSSKQDREILDEKTCEEIPDVIIYDITNNKIHEEIPDVKSSEEKSESSKPSDKMKFNCDMCGANFKKEITLKKHKNTKHDPTYCPHEKKICEGTFGFTIDKVVKGNNENSEYVEKKKSWKWWM
jgi:hypothetical protein